MAQPARKAVALYDEWGPRLHDLLSAVAPDELDSVSRKARLLLFGADPSDQALLWHLIGLVEGRRGHHDKALSAAQRAYSLEPTNSAAANCVGRAFGMLRRPREALPFFEQAEKLAEQGGKPQRLAILNQSIAWSDLRDSSRAEEQLHRALSMKTPVTTAELVSFALASAGLGRDEDCVEYLARAVRAAAGETRGEEPAMEVLDRHPSALPATAQAAVDRVRRRESEEVPPEMALSAKIVLPPAAWERFASLVEE